MKRVFLTAVVLFLVTSCAPDMNGVALGEGEVSEAEPSPVISSGSSGASSVPILSSDTDSDASDSQAPSSPESQPEPTPIPPEEEGRDYHTERRPLRMVDFRVGSDDLDDETRRWFFATFDGHTDRVDFHLEGRIKDEDDSLSDLMVLVDHAPAIEVDDMNQARREYSFLSPSVFGDGEYTLTVTGEDDRTHFGAKRTLEFYVQDKVDEIVSQNETNYFYSLDDMPDCPFIGRKTRDELVDGVLVGAWEISVPDCGSNSGYFLTSGQVDLPLNEFASTYDSFGVSINNDGFYHSSELDIAPQILFDGLYYIPVGASFTLRAELRSQAGAVVGNLSRLRLSTLYFLGDADGISYSRRYGTSYFE